MVELGKRGLKREYSTRYHVIEDYEIDGLKNALNTIESGNDNALAISKSVWKLITKLIPIGMSGNVGDSLMVYITGFIIKITQKSLKMHSINY